ncbi:MAG: serine/threonine protein kinase [Deltaproteobacteria bacterium]|nr:serine/threonine protein kinase [Deltaproteobacteria bacterium]
MTTRRDRDTAPGQGALLSRPQAAEGRAGGPERNPGWEPTALEAKPFGGRRRLGRYVLCGEIAAGGMATVMLGRATGPGGFDKLVALKLIHPRFAREPAFVEMFLDEARIASRIEHPNVCSVFDFGEVDGVYYLAMEYLHGEPASRLLQVVSEAPRQTSSPRLPLFAARIVADACEGLHAAHELRGDKGELLEVVHRDISPHNLFITYDGGVRVVDFGIAHAADKLHRTLTGVVKGKIAYMPPEQLQGGELDRRADVWALGVSLWEMLTCTRLFRRDSELSTIDAVLKQSVPPPSSVRMTVPPQLDPIVLRCLERRPEGRYATARELGRDLGAFIASTGRHVGIADLAEWMEELFAPERDRKRAMIERARDGSVAVEQTETELIPDADEVSRSGPRTVVEKHAPPTAPEPASGSSIPLALDAPTASAVVLPTRRFPFALVLLGVVAMAGLAIFLGSRRPEPRPAPAAPDRGPVSPRPVVPVEVPVVARPTPSPILPPRPPPDLSPSKRVAPRTAPPAAPGSTGARGGRAADLAPPPATPRSSPEGDADRPSVPSEPGFVDVATPGGWADVFVAGAHQGRTPTRVRLPAGRQTIELRPFGDGPPVRIPVQVPPGGGTRLVRPIQSE